MLRRHSSGTVKVSRRVKTLKQTRVDCPARFCMVVGNRPCRDFGPGCICISLLLPVCGSFAPAQITNADVHFRRNGSVFFTPSKYLQYSIINFRKNRFIIRTFRFHIRNKNRKRFTFQNLNRKGKLVIRRMAFKEVNAGCASCAKKRRK
ncbi:hypothetical protein [Longirhabdus pacifica]|uniref:hypothetical protein n=1 Tax=Longirhabdus pacifica TaxID=2305227 RepID=UPI0010090EBF|nr:hypothetical protein [Longirhabdus pacifica]